MNLLRECLRKLLSNLGVPFEELRDLPGAVEAHLRQSVSLHDLLDRVKKDIRYFRNLQHNPRGFFIHLKNLTYPNVPVRANVAVKFFERDGRIIKITAVVHRAVVFMDNGDVEPAFSLEEINRLLAMDRESTRFDKEIRSVG